MDTKPCPKWLVLLNSFFVEWVPSSDRNFYATRLPTHLPSIVDVDLLKLQFLRKVLEGPIGVEQYATAPAKGAVTSVSGLLRDLISNTRVPLDKLAYEAAHAFYVAEESAVAGVPERLVSAAAARTAGIVAVGVADGSDTVAVLAAKKAASAVGAKAVADGKNPLEANANHCRAMADVLLKLIADAKTGKA